MTRELETNPPKRPPDARGDETPEAHSEGAAPRLTTDARSSAGDANSTGRRRALAGLARATPTMLVLAVLGGAGYWGHHVGWKVPAFSELTTGGAAEQEDWCAEHGVPTSICIACNSDLMPKGELHGWCKVHGVAECVLEHPELAQLPETPTISPADLERAGTALAVKERKANDPLCKLHLRRIQFASREAAEKTGVDIRLVERGPIVEVVEANGQVQYDPTRLTRLASRAAGTAWRVEKHIGDRVRGGDVLALVDAAAVGRAKADLLRAAAQRELAETAHQRLVGLSDGVVAGRRVQESEAALAEAQAAVRQAVQELSNLGLPITESEVRGKPSTELAEKLQLLGISTTVASTLENQQASANLLPIVAPHGGVVVARDVAAGEVVEPSKTLFTVVDASRMWLLLDVPLEDAGYVQLGQTAIFQGDGDRREHRGSVTWISTDVDAETRTVKVRAELPNLDGRLRNDSFGAGRIVLREEAEAVIAPTAAIHWEGCCHVAFVRDKDFLRESSYKVFHTRMVRPGVVNGDSTEVIAGLWPGEVVVTQGGGALRAELLKGNLGAG